MILGSSFPFQVSFRGLWSKLRKVEETCDPDSKPFSLMSLTLAEGLDASRKTSNP